MQWGVPSKYAFHRGRVRLWIVFSFKRKYRIYRSAMCHFNYHKNKEIQQNKWMPKRSTRSRKLSCNASIYAKNILQTFPQKKEEKQFNWFGVVPENFPGVGYFFLQYKYRNSSGHRAYRFRRIRYGNHHQRNIRRYWSSKEWEIPWPRLRFKWIFHRI